jgi:hypothetical protein
MVKVGIIGNIASMQSYVQHLKKEHEIEIVGKSSIGLIDQPAGSLLSVPEYAKADLFNEADAIIIDKASMVSFDMLKDAVRNYKHLFLADLPELNTAQCLDLQKLVSEAGSIVQVKNLLMEEPVTHWIAENWQEPAYLNYFEGTDLFQNKRKILIKLLLYAYRLFKGSPQKIRVSGVHDADKGNSFLNIRLDYSNFSALNFELLQTAGSEIKIKAALPGKFIESAAHNQLTLNHQKLHIDIPNKSEFSVFIENLKLQNQKSGTGLDTLHQVLSSYEELFRKLSLYAPWYV